MRLPFFACATLLAPTLAAQTYVNNTTDIPQGAAFNSGFTENVELFDIDGDGDADVLWADGGDGGNQRDRVWVNQGFAQGGALGVLQDETAARWPNVSDASRDVDFADIDLDGDYDAFVVNTSTISNQVSRFMLNMGGAQGGSPGFFQDVNSTRWVNLGVNNGTTSLSSIAPGNVLPSGGFIDWMCDATLVDLDSDGDQDLINATYGTLSQGKVPTRLFLNDGAGYFEEFNPSGHQVTGTDITNGSPGLWSEGVHQHSTTNATGAQCDIATEAISVDAADVDGDYDLDFVLGDRTLLPRLFQNRTAENSGALGFRDISHAALPGPDWAVSVGSYEQEFGDLDLDDDLDLYGPNWGNVCDSMFFNNGNGAFPPGVTVVDTCVRGDEADYVDYDNNGLLDVAIVSRTAPQAMFENTGAGNNWVLDPTTTVMPSFSGRIRGSDACDIDLDGDYDLFLANDEDLPEAFFENTNQISDAFAPRVVNLEQAPARNATPEPTRIRAYVYDNAGWYVTAFNRTTLEYSVNGGGFSPIPMRWSGGQVFRGEIPGFTVGSIDYRVRSRDAYGNTGLSVTKTFVASPCTGEPLVYCTAKTNSAGCVPMIGVTGTPSATAGSGCFVTASQVLDNKSGLLFYSKLGPRFTPYQGGYLCVLSPTVRTPVQNSGASGQPPCTGVFSFDFNAWIASGSDVDLTLGQQVWIQYWSRDPQSSFQTNRTDAVTLFICP